MRLCRRPSVPFFPVRVPIACGLVVGLLAGLVFVPLSASAQTAWEGGGPDIGWILTLSRPFGPQGPIFAGTYGGGIFRSDDDGSSWREATSNARDALVWDVERGEEGSFYAATEDRGVLRLDPGASDFWQPQNTGLNDPFLPLVYSVDVHPGDPLRVSASASEGLYTSRTRGNLWPDSLRVVAGVPVRDVEVLPEAPNTMFGVTPSALVVARGWIGIPESIPAPPLVREGAPVAHNLFDVAPWPGTTDSLVVADFSGAVYQRRGAQLVEIGPDPGTGPVPRFYRSEVAFDGLAPVIYVGADRGLYCTHNRGQIWRRYDGGLGLAKPEVWSLYVQDAAAGELLLGSFTHGVLRGRADGSWEPINRGLQAAWIRGVDAHAGRLLVGTAHGRLFLGTDGSVWTDVTGSLDDVQLAAVHLGRDGSSWLVAGFERIVRSTDEGVTWTDVDLPVGVARIDRFLQPGWAGAPLLAITDDGLIASEDEGASWSAVVGPPTDRPAFAVAAAEGAPVIAVGFDPPVGTGQAPTLWVGGDVPSSWREIPLPAAFDGRIRGLSFLDGEGGSLAVAASPSGSEMVYRVDGLLPEGSPVTFTSLEPGLGGIVDFPVDLAGDPARDVLVLALETGGLLVSEDDGLSWSEWNDGLPTTRCEQIVYDRERPGGAPDRVLVGTFARGAWVRDRPGPVAVAVDGPWVERVGEDVVVRADVRTRTSGAERVRIRRIAGGVESVRLETSAAAPIELREPLAELRALAVARVTWTVDVDAGDGWWEAARVERDLDVLAARLRTRLLGAAPNPFNPRTTIRWEQESAGRVTLDLVDLRGRAVRRLLAGEAVAGRHAVPWDGTDDRNRTVASGTYFVRLAVDGRSWTERITLIR